MFHSSKLGVCGPERRRGLHRRALMRVALFAGGLTCIGCAPDRTGQLNGYAELLDIMKPSLVEAQYGYSSGMPCDLPGSGELGRIEVYVDLLEEAPYGSPGELFKRVRLDVYECGTPSSGQHTSSFVAEFFFDEFRSTQAFRFLFEGRSEGWCRFRSEGFVDRSGTLLEQQASLCDIGLSFALGESLPPIPFETLLRSAFEGCPGCLPPAW